MIHICSVRTAQLLLITFSGSWFSAGSGSGSFRPSSSTRFSQWERNESRRVRACNLTGAGEGPRRPSGFMATWNGREIRDAAAATAAGGRARSGSAAMPCTCEFSRSEIDKAGENKHTEFTLKNFGLSLYIYNSTLAQSNQNSNSQ